MGRALMRALLLGGILAAAAGCAGSPRPLEEPESAMEETEQPAPVEETDYTSSIAHGQEIIADILSPMPPRYKSRTAGECIQVTFTNVGGDNSVDASPVDDLVVFSGDRHSEDYNIYVKSAAGKTVTQKTFSPFDEIQPSFSPDGARIAFASNRNGNFDIWVIETHKNGTAVQVTFTDLDELHPSWTPDGSKLVYSAWSARSGDWNIMLSDLETGEVRELGRGKFPEVSPDGEKVLFQRARKRQGYWYSIWTMNLDGTSQTEIVSSADWAAINPSWSPDGRFITYATVYKSPEAKFEERIWRGDDVYVVNTNGRGLQQVTSDTEPAWDPCWSRHDGRIYFVSERNGFRNIWSVKPPVYTVASSKGDSETSAE